jgi:hypothetical protein
MIFQIPKQFIVDFRWKTVTTSVQENWPFLRKEQVDKGVYNELRKAVSGPQVYRFCFNGTAGTRRCYVGESEQFEHRLSQYVGTLTKLRSKQWVDDFTPADMERACKELQNDSKVRIGAAIQNAELDGDRIDLQVIDFDEFYFNEVSISLEGLSSPFLRRMIENLAILTSETSGFHMLNNGRDVHAKWLSQRLCGNRKAKNHPSGAKAL